MNNLKRQPNPLQLRILMLQAGVKTSILQKVFGVKKAAISMAISGQRPSLHFKILEYVKVKSKEAA
jgi:hypothetical protein